MTALLTDAEIQKAAREAVRPYVAKRMKAHEQVYGTKMTMTEEDVCCTDFRTGYIAGSDLRAKEIEELQRELKEAVGDAAILAHAYSADNRPPTNVVVRSIDRGKKAIGK